MKALGAVKEEGMPAPPKCLPNANRPGLASVPPVPRAGAPGCVGKPHDAVNHPKHYTSHPSGVECIEVVEHMTFCVGNAIKYCWRAGLKTLSAAEEPAALEDLKKARWYLDREIARRERARG